MCPSQKVTLSEKQGSFVLKAEPGKGTQTFIWLGHFPVREGTATGNVEMKRSTR